MEAIKRGFYVFDVDSVGDEEYVKEVLEEFGCYNIRITEREWEFERVFVEFEYDGLLPRNFKDKLASKGVIC